MGRCRGYESRHRIFWNSVRLALKQQVRDLAKSEREKVIRRGEALESSVLGKTGNEVGYPGTEQKNKRPGRGHRTGYGEPCPHASISCASHQLLPPPPTFLLSRKECLVSSSGNDNTENGLPGSKAEEKPPTKV